MGALRIVGNVRVTVTMKYCGSVMCLLKLLFLVGFFFATEDSRKGEHSLSYLLRPLLERSAITLTVIRLPVIKNGH